MKRNLLMFVASMMLYAQTAMASAPAAGDLQTITSLDEVIEIAKDSKKPIILKIGTTWCKFCPQMHEDLTTIAQDPSLGNKFIFLDADGENFDGIKELKVTGYPKVIAFKGGLSPKGELVILDEQIFGDLEDLKIQLKALK